MNPDRRKTDRIKFDQKAQIQAFSEAGELTTEIEAQVITLSPTGISLMADSILPKDQDLKVKMQLPDTGMAIEAAVRAVWEVIGDKGSLNKYGLTFSRLKGIEYKAITSLVNSRASNSENPKETRRKAIRRKDSVSVPFSGSRHHSRRWELPTYTLYINGCDVDAENYEYFAYADKLITNPKTTADIIAHLKEGDIPWETPDYIYARCCIGNEEHNRQAVASAHAAFKVFGSYALPKRAKIMDDIRALLVQHRETLLNLFVAEGHPRKLGEWEFSGMLHCCPVKYR